MKKSTSMKTELPQGTINIPSEYMATSLDEFKNELLGSIGTHGRDIYEAELKEEMLGDVIKHVRKLKKLSQEELGSLVGVGKAQISRIEKNYNNVTIANFLRILNALNVKVRLSVELDDENNNSIELSY